MHVCLRIGEFNKLGECLLYTIKSRALGEECKNATLKREAEVGGERRSRNKMQPKMRNNLRYVYLDCRGVQVQMRESKTQEREGKLYFRRFLKTC